MRLLMTTDTVGGVWTFTSELTRQLLQRGHAVHLVSFGRTPSAEQALLQQELQARFPNTFGFTNSEIPLEWMQNNESVHADGEQLLRHVLQAAAHPEVIVANQFCFGRLDTNVPRIVIAHSDVLSWARACKPDALAGTPWLNRYTSLVQGGLLDASAVIAPTASMGKALANSFFLPNNYLLIPNGTSVEAITENAPVRKLQAITAGRLWDEAKGLDSLLELQSPMPLLVAGETTSPTAEPNGVTSEETSPNNLTHLGSLNRTELHRQFRESAVYLCPSRYEPFGLAPLEAALCGCALVLRNLPSLREVWGGEALYFHDNASLQQALQRLVNEPELLQEAQQRAYQRALQFTPERMADSYLHLFETVLQQQAAQHVA